MSNEYSINALKLFLFKAIDYAGLFPPTSLDLDTAMKNYAKYRGDAEKWMLSRFIIPWSKLPQLYNYGELFNNNPPFLFSVLGAKTTSMNELLDNLAILLEKKAKIHQTFPDTVKVNALELKLPEKIETQPEIKNLIENMTKVILDHSPCRFPMDIFIEITNTREFNQKLKSLVDEIKQFNKNNNNNNKNISFLGYKLRTGGVNKEDFPSVKRIANVIKTCHEYDVPFKATAGLHHPIRHYNESVQTKMHGFINVIGATVLNEANDLSRGKIEQILLEEDSSNFTFTPDMIAWKDIKAHNELIYKSRVKSMTSLGSCSFDEPRDDLRKLNLL